MRKSNMVDDKLMNTNEFTSEDDFFVEVFCQQRNHQGEKICGDVFRTKRVKTEERVIAVLSDGMGHGVRANVLATFTSSLAINFTEEHKDFVKIADIIMNTLPENNVTKTSYSTFTIVDITKESVSILEYESPQTIVIRNNEELRLPWSNIVMNTEKNKGNILLTATFTPQKGDRIIFVSDGVMQSGLGILSNNVGWSMTDFCQYILKMIQSNNHISASELSGKIVNQAFKNDGYHAKDDTSCATIYFRNPRKAILCSGPPFDKTRDGEYAHTLKNFNGKKIVCGGTTVDILSREMKVDVKYIHQNEKIGMPPCFEMQGVDLVTEGVITLTKVLEILKLMKNDRSIKLGNSPADKIVSIFLNSDVIHFVIGTSINEAHQAPDMPVELEFRRTIIKRIAAELDESYLKDVMITYM